MPNEWRPLSKIIINNIEYQVTDQIVQELLEIIQENNGEVSLRLNNLNTRVNNNYSYIQTINNYLPSYTNVQSNWNETNTLSYSYIQNKPNIIKDSNDSLIISNNNAYITMYSHGSINILSKNDYSLGDASINIGNGEISFNTNVVNIGNSNFTTNSRPYYYNENGEDYFAFQSESFQGSIRIFNNDERDLDEISDGIYKIRYVWYVEDNGEQISDDIIINQGILIQKSQYDIENFDINDPETYEYISTPLKKDQYMYIDGIIKHRTTDTEDISNWQEWQIIGNSKSDWNENNNTSYSYILNKPTFKTVNNESLVGSGNIVVSGLPQVSSSDNGKILMVVNGQWQLVSPSVLYSGNGIPNNNYGNNGDLFIQTD